MYHLRVAFVFKRLNFIISHIQTLWNCFETSLEATTPQFIISKIKIWINQQSYSGNPVSFRWIRNGEDERTHFFNAPKSRFISWLLAKQVSLLRSDLVPSCAIENVPEQTNNIEKYVTMWKIRYGNTLARAQCDPDIVAS